MRTSWNRKIAINGEAISNVCEAERRNEDADIQRYRITSSRTIGSIQKFVFDVYEQVGEEVQGYYFGA
jgi:hypothetical protein